MDFTEIYRQSSGLVAFRHGAHFILTAVADSDRLIVRRAVWVQTLVQTPFMSHIHGRWPLRHHPQAALASLLASAAATALAAVSLGPPKAGRRTDNTTQTPVIGWSSDSEYVFAACQIWVGICLPPHVSAACVIKCVMLA